ncbi:MAG TPA: TPM domain-containing protein [Candidatus Rifleibacterium sp.]|nr:TPM domain-containing protein [Candidatus Rifleibacterium sp.]HPT46996.1 TPM domain-containing protein [Candidatus Rifleibacterium sp.]
MGSHPENHSVERCRLRVISCLLLSLLLGLVLPVEARQMPIRRVPLNDEILLLDASTATEVKRYSQLLYRDYRSEMAVLIIRSTDGEKHSVWAEKVFNHWGLGQAGVNNGMLILFAIDDRRVEIKPGIRYKNRFTADFCSTLLNRYVVPAIRANRPAQGVLAAAREVAAEIRSFEDPAGLLAAKSSQRPGETGVSGNSGPAQNLNKNSLPTASSSHKVSGKGYSSSSSANANKNVIKRPTWVERQRATLDFYLARPLHLVVYAIIAISVLFGLFFFQQTFMHGRLIMPVWLFVFIMLASVAACAGLVSTMSDFFEGFLDSAFSCSGGVALLSFLICTNHICPRCKKYMNVDKRTLRSPTYTSSGLGEKTVHCDNCGYHNVSTYTISRRTKSSSSSGRRSSGGRCSGGGGGASW